MKKREKPTFVSDDGTLHDTAHKAAGHDAISIFKSIFHIQDRDNDDVSFDVMAPKWQEIRTRLNTLHDEFLAVTKIDPIPEKVMESRFDVDDGIARPSDEIQRFGTKPDQR